MRIATYNIENLDEAEFNSRKNELVPTLQRLRADVLLMQEVNSQEKKLKTLRELFDLPKADYKEFFQN